MIEASLELSNIHLIVLSKHIQFTVILSSSKLGLEGTSWRFLEN